ncbi:TPA: NisI/SpaI family lantibiotic immunity lipoprotein [Clostridioides difficile]|nr:NisI/SpaI family lantibiotic immunity lipoprotein [Clostridioides difficile]HBH4040930.1 NisI/SpaI family lantibiotic immunity lipoprotein [Clostridioides difficile]HCU2582842.1 NisI/SpaI family lantibiotic immunity lipoprotein [Clostridioides difficile]HCU2766835.1 NisI/SpaI family lantibiotic immunity lipoprotein [Clostridioides difficile]
MTGRERKKMSKKKLVLRAVLIVSILLIVPLCLYACRLHDTAEKNKQLNATLPYVELDPTNYEILRIDGVSYLITEETVEYSDLDKEIGQISKQLESVNGETMSYGYVYQIKDTSVDKKIAVNINNKYFVASIDL